MMKAPFINKFAWIICGSCFQVHQQPVFQPPLFFALNSAAFIDVAKFIIACNLMAGGLISLQVTQYFCAFFRNSPTQNNRERSE